MNRITFDQKADNIFWNVKTHLETDVSPLKCTQLTAVPGLPRLGRHQPASPVNRLAASPIMHRENSFHNLHGEESENDAEVYIPGRRDYWVAVANGLLVRQTWCNWCFCSLSRLRRSHSEIPNG